MHSKDFPDCFYRVSVKGLFVKDGKLLLLKEPEALSGQWELPGGGLDFGEHPHAGLKREIEEELHLRVTSISDHPVYVWPALFEGWRDMEWYYSMVLAYRIELESLDFTPSSECEAIQMCTKEELDTLDLYEQVVPLREHFNPEHFKLK